MKSNISIRETLDAQNALNVPSNMLIMLAVMGGYNYATKISEKLVTKQPVATRALLILKKVGLLNPKRAGQSVQYIVNWDFFVELFYNSLDLEIGVYVKNYLSLSSNNHNLKKLRGKILVKSFIIDYFTGYFDTILNLADFKAEERRFEDIVDLIFISLSWIYNNQKEEEWNMLIKKYDLEEKKLLELINFMEQVIAGVSIVNMDSMPR